MIGIVLLYLLLESYYKLDISTLNNDEMYNYDYHSKSLLVFIFFIYLSFKPPLYIIYEMMILAYLLMEDEMNMEVSLDILFLLLLIKIIEIIGANSFNIIILAISIVVFLIIYIFSKGNFGLGDIALSIILSIGLKDNLQFTSYFLFMFSIPAILILFQLLLDKVKMNDSIPFIKYVVLAYYITIFMEINFYV